MDEYLHPDLVKALARERDAWRELQQASADGSVAGAELWQEWREASDALMELQRAWLRTNNEPRD